MLWSTFTLIDYLNFSLGRPSSSSVRTFGSGLGLVNRDARTLVRTRSARRCFPSSYERKNSQRKTRLLVLLYQEHGRRFRLNLYPLWFCNQEIFIFFYSVTICALTKNLNFGLIKKSVLIIFSGCKTLTFVDSQTTQN